MAVRLTCPACAKALEIDDDAVGKEVECGECLEVFVAKKPKLAAEPSAGVKGIPARSGVGKRRRDDDDDDDEDYEPRPRRRSRRGYAPARSRLVYILLALFLGSWGVHNFYAGRTGAGVAQLLITVISFGLMCVIVGFVTIFIPMLWAIIEIVVVTRDGNGVPLE
jgi:predicted Zn finger-like uncharacterized protein